MVTERLIIEVSEKGTRIVKRNIQDIGKQSKRTAQLVQTLKQALLFVGVGAAIRGVVGTLAQFGQTMSTVRAITGATEKEFSELTKEAKTLGAVTRFSATQAGEGMLFLARAGFEVDEVLASVGDTLNLAQAGALDLGSAADIASNVLTGFRLEAEEAGRVVDVLALAANSANTTVFQLGEAMKFVAPVAAGLGVSLEEATAAASALSDAGLQASLAGTGLRKILAELAAPSTRTQKILKELGLTTRDVSVAQVGLTQALRRLRDAGVDTTLAFEIFQQRGGPAFEVLATAIPKIEQMNEALNDAAGTAERVAGIMDENLNGALLRVRSALEAVILALESLKVPDALGILADVVATIARSISQLVKDVGEAFEFLDRQFTNITRTVKDALITFFTLGLVSSDTAKELEALEIPAREVADAVEDQQSAFKKLLIEREKQERSVRNLLESLDLEIRLLRMSATERVIEADLIKQVNKLKIGENTNAVKSIKSRLEEIELLRQQNALTRELETPAEKRAKQLETLNRLREINNRRLREGTITIREFIEARDALAELESRLPPLPTPMFEVPELGTSPSVEALNRQLMVLRETEGLLGLERQQQNAIIRARIELERNLTAEEENAVRNRVKDIAQLQLKAQVLDKVVGSQQQLGVAQEVLNEALENGSITLSKYTELLGNYEDAALRASLSAAEFKNSQQAANIELAKGVDSIRQFNATAQATRGVGQFLQNISDISGAVSGALTQAFDRATDALADFVISGLRNTEDLKKAFSELLRDLAKQLVKIIIQTLILKAIQAAIPGGAAVPTIPAVPRQAGGPVAADRPFLVGERGPEIFNPPGQGNIVPTSRIGEQVQMPSFTIVNVTDPDEVSAAINTPEGEQAILNVIDRNRTTVRRQLS